MYNFQSLSAPQRNPLLFPMRSACQRRQCAWHSRSLSSLFLTNCEASAEQLVRHSRSCDAMQEVGVAARLLKCRVQNGRTRNRMFDLKGKDGIPVRGV